MIDIESIEVASKLTPINDFHAGMVAMAKVIIETQQKSPPEFEKTFQENFWDILV